jgi:hypothetical protein
MNPGVPRHDAGDGINATGIGAGTGANTGLPCDVQQVLENRCIGCHLAGGQPPELLAYDDLLKPSTTNPSQSVAQRCLARMQDTMKPMPPPPAVPPAASEIATFQAWVTAKTPRGSTCTNRADAGSATYNTPTVCTSNKTAAGGESASMRPGEPCITCHAQRGGPAFTIAGTVYPTAHEPNDCDGVAGGLTVVVTGADNTTVNVPVNNVGNFSERANIVPPFHVKVTNGTKERVMATALTGGDCNTCHTVTGVNGAPGRIMAP